MVKMGDFEFACISSVECL